MRAVYEGRVERTAVHKGHARETAVRNLLLYLNKSIKIPGFGMHPFASGVAYLPLLAALVTDLFLNL